ncbi:MAG: LCP family protein, partial [Syntrophomonas sp.]
MKKTISFFKLMLVVGLVFGIFFGMGTGLAHLFNGLTGTSDASNQKEEEKVTVEEGERTSILLLGVDARPGDDHPRSDTMLLATIDPKLNKAAVISIPRDTKVKLKNGQIDKINAANSIGGPEYAADAVEDLMGTKVDYYMEVDFNGFKDIIDTLGGVTINVPQRMYKPSEDINLYPGTQKLDGRKALAFVRCRDYPMGDIERTMAQQEFMKALAGEILKPSTITKLPQLVRKTKQYVNTNLTISDMVKMASWAPGFTKDSIITQTLPGTFYDERDSYGNLLVSYWQADKDQLPKLVDNMFAGKTVAVVQEGSYSSVKAAPAGQVQNAAPDEEQEAAETGNTAEVEESDEADSVSTETTKPSTPVSSSN